MNDYIAFILISIGVTFAGLQLDSNIRDNGSITKNRTTYKYATMDQTTTETNEDGSGGGNNGWDDE